MSPTSGAPSTFAELRFGDLLAGDVALVTGASQGLGRAMARDLADCGATVVAVARDRAAVEAFAKEMTASTGRDHLGLGVDVADRSQCDAAAKRIEDVIGPISILINNAGLFRRTNLEDPEFSKAFEIQQRTNVDGVMNMVLATLGQIRRNRGRIVNVASIAGLVAHTFDAAGYAATKAAVMQLTRSLACDLAQDGVRVNCVAPGVMVTPLSAPGLANESVMSTLMAHTPMRRPGQANEISGPVLFLASAMSSYVTGVTLAVDGGFLAV